MAEPPPNASATWLFMIAVAALSLLGDETSGSRPTTHSASVMSDGIAY
jgi:hypothetical protein